jgi:hypothetical protein
MNENASPLDLEKEKQTNKNLAIAVGVLGLGAFGAFYVLFFFTMVFKPGLLFNLMPMHLSFLVLRQHHCLDHLERPGMGAGGLCSFVRLVSGDRRRPADPFL